MGVIRTQAILAGITFALLCAGFALLGVPLWGLVALGVTLFDLIPLVGSGMVMIPWGVILLVAGDAGQGLRLLILYVVIFAVRQVLDPILNGKAIGVGPVWTLLSTTVLTLLLGPWGLLLGSVAAVVAKTALEIITRRRVRNRGRGTGSGPGGDTDPGGDTRDARK